jgi:hypothetical protein
MNNCLNCPHYAEIIEDDSGYTEARCKATKSKKGKMLTWSHTILNSPNEFDIKITGKDNVRQMMEKKKIPTWCPLNE